MNEALRAAVAACVGEATGESFTIGECRSQGGGCINQAFVVGDGRRRYFVKTNAGDRLEMFRAEAAALEALAATRTLRVPRPVGEGRAAGRAFFVMEAVEFGPPGDWREMGRQLAALHANEGPAFGWDRDNTIGTTPQRNGWREDWVEFFRECRLRPQFELAAHNGHRFEGAGALLDGLGVFFEDPVPAPSLLHGDLWPGNASFDRAGQPVVYDPASYYGDRETDLAFSECFGGFPPAFYEGYRKAWPPGPGYPARRELYNLYHILNHANLFGGEYAAQAEAVISRLRCRF